MNDLTFLEIESVEKKPLTRIFKSNSNTLLSGLLDRPFTPFKSYTVGTDGCQFSIGPDKIFGITRISSTIPNRDRLNEVVNFQYGNVLDILPFRMTTMTETGLQSKLSDIASTNEVIDTSKIRSSISIKINDGSKLIETETSIKSSLLESDITTGDGGSQIGKMDMTLEVFRLCEYQFEFPKNFLLGLESNDIATVNGDILTVYTTQFGERILYTTKGQIKIRTLPGMKQRTTALLSE